MSNHSEKCPVCDGTGNVPGDMVSNNSDVKYKFRTCHGCDGKGWVTVDDDPTPTSPEVKFITNSVDV